MRPTDCSHWDGSLLGRVADRQATLSETADYLKKGLHRARTTCFVLTITGAIMTALASGLTDDTYRGHLTWTAAAALTIATFVSGRLLSRSRTALHIEARGRSEALKREANLYATFAGVYREAHERNTTLLSALKKFGECSRQLSRCERNCSGKGSSPRSPLDCKAYIQQRIDGQIDYYIQSASQMTKPADRLHKAELLLAGAAATLTAIAASMEKGTFDLAAITAVVTTVAATIVARIESSRYDEQIASYRATANRLLDEKTVSAGLKGLADTAERAEAIIAAETKSWQTTW